MTVWMTSDLHLGHRAVAYDRRYGSWPEDRSLVTDEDVKWHDQTLADNWDALVKPEDTVWVLGDNVINAKHLDEMVAWISARPGYKHAILGNHDPAHPMHVDSIKYEGHYRKVFKSVGIHRKRKIMGQYVHLSHFPYDGDGAKEDRAQQWRLPNLGTPIIHGHVHSKVKMTEATYVPGQGSLKPTKQIHVGLDAWDLKPVALDEIGALL